VSAKHWRIERHDEAMPDVWRVISPEMSERYSRLGTSARARYEALFFSLQGAQQFISDKEEITKLRAQLAAKDAALKLAEDWLSRLERTPESEYAFWRDGIVAMSRAVLASVRGALK